MISSDPLFIFGAIWVSLVIWKSSMPMYWENLLRAAITGTDSEKAA